MTHRAADGNDTCPDSLPLTSCCTDEEEAMVVDRRWYLQRYKDVANAGLDPKDHYVRHGRDEGRFPNAAAEELHRVGLAYAAQAETIGQLAHELAEIRQQLASLATERHLAEFADQLRDVRQHLPAFLNAMATIPALGHEFLALKAANKSVGESLRALDERVSHAPVRDNPSLGAMAAVHAALDENCTEHGKLWKSAEESGIDRANLWKSAEQATRSIGELWHRIEFVRKEIMYEMRFGLAPSTDREKTKIVDEAKLNAARASRNVRLNLGSGQIPLNGYINIDARDLPGVDIVTDAGNLPFENGSIEEIVSFHVLEHFPEERLRRLLPYWRSLLRSGGTFRAVVPDGEAMLSRYAAGSYPFEHFRTVLFGAQEYEGDCHFNMFTPDSLYTMLKDTGFQDIKVPTKARKNDISFEFEIIATSP